MANYREVEGQANAWTRAFRIVLENPRNAVASALFYEEKVVKIGDDEVSKPFGHVKETFTPENANTTFPLLNPQTGDVIGTASYGQVYAIMHSLYIHLANERDIQNLPAPTPEPTEAPEPEVTEEPAATPEPTQTPEPEPTEEPPEGAPRP